MCLSAYIGCDIIVCYLRPHKTTRGTLALVRSLERTLGLRRDAGKMAPITRVPVNQRRMLRDAVVPNHDGALLPLDAGLEVGAPSDVLIQELEDDVRLFLLRPTVSRVTVIHSVSLPFLPGEKACGSSSYSHWGLTKRAFSPVTGCVRTMGCTFRTGSRR